MAFIVLLVVLAVLAFWLIGAYNKLIVLARRRGTPAALG